VHPRLCVLVPGVWNVSGLAYRITLRDARSFWNAAIIRTSLAPSLPAPRQRRGQV